MDSFGQINRSISVLLFFVVSSASCFRIGSLGKTRLPLSMTTVQGAAPAIKLSPMVENMAVSKTIEIHALTKEMEKNGQTVFSLCVGEPDYEPPAEVVAATVSFQFNELSSHDLIKYMNIAYCGYKWFY